MPVVTGLIYYGRPEGANRSVVFDAPELAEKVRLRGARGGVAPVIDVATDGVENELRERPIREAQHVAATHAEGLFEGRAFTERHRGHDRWTHLRGSWRGKHATRRGTLPSARMKRRLCGLRSEHKAMARWVPSGRPQTAIALMDGLDGGIRAPTTLAVAPVFSSGSLVH